MQFYVFDNYNTFNRIFPFNGIELTRLQTNGLYLMPNGAFWFHTRLNREEQNTNIKKPYVHIHPNILSMNRLETEKPPIELDGKNFKYNPNNGCVEVNPSRVPWKKPLWKKNVTYYGTVPSKKIGVKGPCYYNYSMQILILTLDFFATKKKDYKWYDSDSKTAKEKLNELEKLSKKLHNSASE